MGRRIGVLGVCDTGGLTASLRLLMPRDIFIPLTWPHGDADAQREWFAATLAESDHILVNTARGVPPLVADNPQHGKIIRYPYLVFHAFHPDMTYVSRMIEGQHHLIEPAYNSCICVWAYLQGISADRTAGLFNHEVFSRLGYYSEWDGSVSALSKQFTELGYNFSRFFHKAKRTGAFMLSLNHPKITAIEALAKCIAIDKLGEPAAIADIPIYSADHLAGLAWPVYPEIGEFYGIRSRYDFVMDGKVLGLEEFISSMYQCYDSLNLKRDETFFGRPGFRAVIDAVLGRQAP